jgi:hypothetical protein
MEFDGPVHMMQFHPSIRSIEDMKALSNVL